MISGIAVQTKRATMFLVFFNLCQFNAIKKTRLQFDAIKKDTLGNACMHYKLKLIFLS